MPRRGRRNKRRGPALWAIGLMAAGASCGTRTGLFVEGFGPADAGQDVLAVDAALDAPLDAPPDAVPCLPGRFDFTLARAQLMFVIDRSGSMEQSLTSDDDPSPGQPSRWQALRDALAATLGPLDAEVELGAKFYPDPTVFEGCRLDGTSAIPPALGNLSALMSVFSAQLPFGGTPTAEATRLAAELLKQRRGAARTLVIATDGAPNCNATLNRFSCVCTTPNGCGPDGENAQCLDDLRTVSTIATIANDEKIPVYVIGIGGTTQPAFGKTLDDMAVAGGRARATSPRYYPAQSQAELGSALTAIRDGVARCTYLTPSAPTNPDFITVEIDGVPVPRDVTRQNGWDWVDKDYGQLAMFGDACDGETDDGGVAVVVSGVVRCD